MCIQRMRRLHGEHALALIVALALVQAPTHVRGQASQCVFELEVNRQCGGNFSNPVNDCMAFAGCTMAPWRGACCPVGAGCANIITSGSYCWTCGGAVPQALTAAADATASQPQLCAGMVNGDFDYGCVLGASISFYAAQRSGKLQPGGGTPSWRGDSLLADVAPNGAPLAGGWYDAGDFSKFLFPGAWAAANLGLAYLEFPEAFSGTGQVDAVLANLRWYADFLVACHYEPGSFVAATWAPPTSSVGAAHMMWGRPEELTVRSKVVVVNGSTPASDLRGQAVAALAAAAAAWRATDPGYAAMLLTEAQVLYGEATELEGLYSASLPEVATYYKSFTFLDDLSFAAAMLALASGDGDRLKEAKAYFQRHKLEEGGGEGRRYDYNNVAQAAGYLIAKQDPASAEEYSQPIRDTMAKWLGGTDGIEYTPKGLAFIDAWGNLRYVANQAFIGLLHNKLYPKGARRAQVYTCFARKQMRYVLGETGRSFVVGVGPSSGPCRPHHRGSSCGPLALACDCSALESPACNPGVLYGALVGGPDQQDAYSDDRKDHRGNEVAVDWNAGFTGVMAGLRSNSFTWAQCQSAGLSDGRGSVSTVLSSAAAGQRLHPMLAAASAAAALLVAALAAGL